ncbi:MAG: hypothetical protein ACTSPW_09520 [Promethearchaeota archaeon]
MSPIKGTIDKNSFCFYCIIDEAHRLAYDKSPLADIMRELRRLRRMNYFKTFLKEIIINRGKYDNINLYKKFFMKKIIIK